MDAIRSFCSSAWTRISNFVQAAFRWTVEMVTTFFSWLKGAFTDLLAKIKNAMGKSALSTEEKEFLKQFDKDLQNLNNKLPQMQEICKKAANNGTEDDKQKAANSVKTIGETIKRAYAG